jgi:hypothetical protein
LFRNLLLIRHLRSYLNQNEERSPTMLTYERSQ